VNQSLGIKSYPLFQRNDAGAEKQKC